MKRNGKRNKNTLSRLDYIVRLGSATAVDISGAFGIEVCTASGWLMDKMKKGVLVCDKSTKPYKYALASNVRL